MLYGNGYVNEMIILPAKWILLAHSFCRTPETWLVGSERMDCPVGVWALSLHCPETNLCVFHKVLMTPNISFKQVFCVAFKIYALII